MILIVDDDNAVRMSISLALKRAGYEPLAVKNQEEALAAVRDEKVSMAILDMNLTPSTTGEQGIEILRRFRILRPDMEGVAELASKKLIKSLNFHKLRLFYVHKVL